MFLSALSVFTTCLSSVRPVATSYHSCPLCPFFPVDPVRPHYFFVLPVVTVKHSPLGMNKRTLIVILVLSVSPGSCLHLSVLPPDLSALSVCVLYLSVLPIGTSCPLCVSCPSLLPVNSPWMSYMSRLCTLCLSHSLSLVLMPRYSGGGGGVPELPAQAAALWSHQHCPNHPQGSGLSFPRGPQ